MQAGTHPDYTLEPEKGKNTLGIDAVREVSEKLYEYARLGGAKVVWLKDAALLTEAAANALLKPEEPPENTGFPLLPRAGTLAGDAAQSLPSSPPRCPSGIPVARGEREVTVSQDAARSALRLCSGAPAAALALLQPECGPSVKRCVVRLNQPSTAMTG